MSLLQSKNVNRKQSIPNDKTQDHKINAPHIESKPIYFVSFNEKCFPITDKKTVTHFNSIKQ